MSWSSSENNAGRPQLVGYKLFLRLGRICFLTALLVAHMSIPVVAEDAIEALKALSLEQLADIKVSVATRTPTAVADSAAAVFVVTQDDIRRSGATSIPEALRMVPGINVARIDANKWAVTARGFNGHYANKLLVLVDGRTVYTPMFSGVFWNAQDTMLEDVERIEVIRGPGASAWGANAVNGVINIITRSSDDTRGNLVTVAIGDPETVNAALRHGGALSDDASYRIYAKARQHDVEVLPGGDDAHDDWEDVRAGFRLDAAMGADDAFTLQGDIYHNRAGETVLLPDIGFGTIPNNAVNDDDGAHILGRWNHFHANDSESILQVYYDYQDREAFNDTRHTLDLDYQRRLTPWGIHEVTLGAGLRYYKDRFKGLDQLFQVDPADHDYQLFSAFLQDEIALAPDWSLTLGARLEHNDFTGFEIQPSARLLWRPAQQQTVWASFSRAVRTPSRTEDGGSVFFWVVPAAPPEQPSPVTLMVYGSRDFEAEKLMAYELGYRIRLSQRFSVDMSAFYHDYKDLRTLEPGTLDFSGFPEYIEQPYISDNRSDAATYGLELATDWRPTDGWRWWIAYSLLDIDVDLEDDSASFIGESAEGQSPQQQLSLRTGFDPFAGAEADFWLRYVDDLPDQTQQIDAYWTLDARLAWRPRKDLELSIVGQNLLDARHAEFKDELQTTIPTELRRGFYAKLTWDF